ncbi:MAG: DUF302 domain-containing protein [Proteobacteria bacterium]|nr:DUF302 domain-containing protein [Pseudomonadota bacterium]
MQLNFKAKFALPIAFVCSLLFLQPAFAIDDGLIIKTSDFDVGKTLDRLGIALERNGIKVFARVDHAKGAKSVDLELMPNSVLIFGNPKLGTPLMTANPAIGLDLPLKAVAWQEKDGTVKLAYTDPNWLAARYGITDREKVFMKMTGALKKFTDMAVTKGALPKK